MQQTSLESWVMLQDEIGRRQQEVYMALDLRPMSNRELSDYLQRPINCITPRVKELRELGLVAAECVKTDEATNRKVIVWRSNANRT